MQHDFTKLRQALRDPADGPYAVAKMRELLLEALQAWPIERYQVADYLLPHGSPIRKGARGAIEGLLGFITGPQAIAVNDILKVTEVWELLNN
ncbi:hypothetical protein [Pseudomonas aeruginosa]|uniref:hypothetical protein n=1 Tax=Pseudomonas aeruginosa TaxID=287 RepID=UPI0005BDCEAA|nr:hypothetical protein [Pseudomonas aeruginosa]MCO2180205.1 hypothetical protein [Pseudomonas aeruginosa]MDV6775034.1 hypothetical protein [Pseudomonas aeruginosa]HBO4168677.1 hypothetical protein [Pseudomonas aeruginosa]HBP0509942.1 hypothetical protein [Pseudomonas aeruginosa]